MAAALMARGDAASLASQTLSKVRVSGLRFEFETYSTGGENVSTPDSDAPQSSYPSFLGFDHGQSFYVDFEAKPSEAVVGRLSLNLLGNVPGNPIDEIFYENRGRSRSVTDTQGDPLELNSLDRVHVHHASVDWDDRWFTLSGFYRVGHLHWQYEGDFFGLYRDAYYGENIDIYNGEAPIGFEMAGKRQLDGAAFALGPELWWGANPAMFLRYGREFAGARWTGVFQEDFGQRTDASSSIAIPVRDTRKLSLQVQDRWFGFDLEAGALWSGQPRVGESFQLVDDSVLDGPRPIDPADIRQDVVRDEDSFGFKGKVIWQRGRWNWYGQGAYMGLVAEGGPTSIPTFTGWTLRDSGSGNQVNALSGLAVGVGQWQIGPNFLWQKPIVGPMPSAADLQFTQGRPRNVLDDPFAVRGNREMTAAELMLTYDPTPATWMWAWDSDRTEDAGLAASLGLVLQRHPTTADAGLYVAANGDVYPFEGATPARDWGELWELRSRVVNRLGRHTRMISHVWFGTAEPNGDDPRLLHRFGVDSRVTWNGIALAGHVKLNDYGPYDYQRDFNFSYPLQLMGDLSFNLGQPRWLDLPQTRIGVRTTYRTLDRHSNRYLPEGVAPPAEGEILPDGYPEGHEWEIRSYLHFAI